MIRFQVGDKVVPKPHLWGDLVNYGIQRDATYVIDSILVMDAMFVKVKLLHGGLIDFWVNSKYWTRSSATFVIDVMES